MLLPNVAKITTRILRIAPKELVANSDKAWLSMDEFKDI
jgi:hypothetical protein